MMITVPGLSTAESSEISQASSSHSVREDVKPNLSELKIHLPSFYSLHVNPIAMLHKYLISIHCITEPEQHNGEPPGR